MSRHRYTSRPSKPTHGYIFIIKEGVGEGAAAFDGNVFRTTSEAREFVDEVTGGDSVETRRILRQMELEHATAEEAEAWREAKG